MVSPNSSIIIERGVSMVVFLSMMETTKRAGDINIIHTRRMNYDTSQYAKYQNEYSTEEYNLTYFEEDTYSYQHKLLVSNIRHIKCSTNRTIDLSGYKISYVFTLISRQKKK